MDKGLAMTSFWSMNRDAQLESNSGIPRQYAFTNIFKNFGTGDRPVVNKAPELNGVVDITLTVGDVFEPMAGVKAYDAEDGDLTHLVEVTGQVDTGVEGIYRLTYSVTDSEGLATTKTRKVTVEAAPVIDPTNTYDPTKIYNTGDQVIYNGKEYTAKWWTQGDIPGQADVWQGEIILNPDGSQDYVSGATYVEGDIVTYNGKTYKAKWWTQATPGTDDA